MKYKNEKLVNRAVGMSISIHLALFALLGAVHASLPAPAEIFMVDLIEVGEPTTIAPTTRKRAAPARTMPENGPAGLKANGPTTQSLSTDSTASIAEVETESLDGVARKVSLEDFYKAQVWRELQKNKTYPAVARRLGQTGRVILKFKVGKGGEILSSQLVEKSSFSSLNQAAEGLLASLSGFQPIPEELKRLSWEFTVPVEYRLE